VRERERELHSQIDANYHLIQRRELEGTMAMAMTGCHVSRIWKGEGDPQKWNQR
jgi:hypothetical protein